MRVNGYFPVTSTTSGYSHPQFAGFIGHSLRVKRKVQSAMRGVDGELGAHIGKSCDYDFYAALGPYYFKGKHVKAAVGGKARVAVSYKDYLTLEISDSQDSVFNNRVQGQLTLSVPLGPATRLKKSHNRCPPTCDFGPSCPKTDDNAYALTQRLFQPVARQEIVVVGSSSKTQTASNAFSIIFVNNLSHSDGTFESPYPTLALAQANSSPGDIIYVFPGDGTTNGMDAGIVLQPNQSFWGSNVGHTVSTNVGTVTIPAQSSTAPQISNAGSNVITVASGVDASGFAIVMPHSIGVSGTSVDGVTISDMTIVGSGDIGIALSNTGTASLARLYITACNNGAINLSAISGGQSNFAISDTTSYLTKGNGILVNANNSSGLNVLMNNSTVSANFGDGVILVGTTGTLNFTADQNSIINNQGGDAGLFFNVDATTLNMLATNTAFTGNTSTGILFQGTLGTLNTSLINSSVSNNLYGVSLAVTSNSLNCLVSDSSFTGNAREGITVGSTALDTLNFSASGCLFEGNGHRGILINVSPFFASAHTNVDIQRCSIINNSQIGMDSGLYINYNPLTPLNTLNVNVTDNLFTDNNAVGLNIQTAVTNTGIMNINVSSNTAGSNSNFAGINWTDASPGTVTANAVFADNVLNGNTGNGMAINSEGNTKATVLVKSNVFINNTDAGLYANQMGTGSLCLTIDSNNSDNGFNFLQTSGTFNVVNLGNIGTITSSGTIGNPVICPN